MRIILLDHSGSMGEPFSGKTEFAGRTRKTEAAKKLEAAKTELLRSIASLSSTTTIALFEFTSSASLIYEGMSNNPTAIKSALDDLEAEDGTDIAAALDEAFEYVAKLENSKLIQVLVISDGLSDLNSAQMAAQRLARRRVVVINVILIDPTDDGEQVARAIAMNGDVYAVTSSGEFTERISGVTEEQEILSRQVSSALDEYQEEEDTVIKKVAPDERLSFTAAYPGAISPDSWYSLLVYLHLAHLQQDVTEFIRQRAIQLGLKPLTSSAEPVASVERGTWLKLIPHVEGIVFNPLSQEVAWLEDIQESNFRLIADKNVIRRSLLGGVDVYCGPALIAQIPLSFSVHEHDTMNQTAMPTTTTAQVFNRIFASYSRKDTPIVDACVAVYEALGIYVYIDKHSLRSGQIWHAMLHQFIDKSDLFQLYWSKSSSQSQPVEDEWKYALSLVGRKGETFIRPLYWEEDWPKPPTPLAHIHFAKLNLADLALQTGQSNLIGQVTQSASGSVSTPPLSVAVIPVLPGIPAEIQKTLREDTAYAVNFLEEATGLRYYPVPTLLVDEHVVKSVRSLHTIDWTPQSDQIDQALAFSDVLRSIELEFHVRGWHPKSSNLLENWETLFGKGQLITGEQFDCLRRLCEGMLQETVRQYIWPRWVEARAEMSGEVLGINRDQSFSEFILAVLAYAISTAETQQRTLGLRSGYGIESDKLRLMKDLMASAGIRIWPTNNEDVYISLENTSFDTLVSALRFCHQELSPGLSSYDNVDASFPIDPIPDSERYETITTIVGMIAREVFRYDSPLQNLGEWLADVTSPWWREARDELANLNFHDFSRDTDYFEFISACLNTIHNMLQKGLTNLGNFPAECGYAIKQSSWDILCKEIPWLSSSLSPKISKQFSRDEESVLLEGAFSEFVRLYTEAKDRLIGILSERTKLKTPLEHLFTVQVPTYGIYAPPSSYSTDEQLKKWAFHQGIPIDLTFPQNPRVLFCLTALERFERDAEKVLPDRRMVQQIARDFQRSVLVHEHFHAILETGLDDKRSPANGAKFEEAWRNASPLNESLAAWMELHHARQNSELVKLVWSYIRAGSYPEWPYRGAEKIEALYQKQGVEAVQNLILSIRRDPEAARTAFDAANWD